MTDFGLVIKEISAAHKFSLSTRTRFECPLGRGQYGVVLCIAGSADFKFYSRESVTLSPGDMLFLSPSAAYYIEFEREFVHYTVNFSAECESGFFSSSEYVYLGADEADFSLHLLSRITTEVMRGNKLLALSHLYELVASVSSVLLRRESSALPSMRLLRAKEYIDTHPKESFTLSTLAEMSGMSLTSFRREWQRVYGETAIQYRDRKRLELAVSYLSSGYYNVSEVAALVGFDDVSYFVRFFVKHKKITPGRLMRG